MSLWGMKDSIATAGTAAVADTGAVTGASGADFTSYEVGDFLRIGANDYVFTAIADATNATVRQADGTAAIAVSSAAAYEVSQKPLSLVYSENVDAATIYGADTAEMTEDAGAQGIAHAGWLKRTAGSGGRAGRVHYETLVAASSVSGDAGDDSVLPE